MKEKNHHILTDALNKLPQYEAPESAWENIQDELGTSEQDALRNKLQQLPVYKAPDQVWSRIQGELKGRSRPLYLKPWALAAMFLLLVSLAGLWNMLDKKQVPEVAPMTEKKVPLSEMTDIQIADFEDQMATEEAELKACMEVVQAETQDSLHPEIAAELEQLEELTQTRDSLSHFLTSGKGLPGTSPRLDLLEAKRNTLIKNLREKLCAEE